MVFFKVNRKLAHIIALANMKNASAIGCSKDCDKQLISLDHLEICLQHISNRVKELEKKLEEQKIFEEVASFGEVDTVKPQSQAEVKEAMRRL